MTSNKTELAAPVSRSFTFQNSNPIRVMLRDGDPWFVAIDVCSALDIVNASQSVAALDDDERSMLNIGRQGNAHIISESGLYTLILRCRGATTPGTVAHRFRKWVTSEVLPAIRKTGHYEQPAQAVTEQPKLASATLMTAQHITLLQGVLLEACGGSSRAVHLRTWAKVREQFGVASFRHIPDAQFDEVRSFLLAQVPRLLGQPEEEPVSVRQQTIDMLVMAHDELLGISQNAQRACLTVARLLREHRLVTSGVPLAA